MLGRWSKRVIRAGWLVRELRGINRNLGRIASALELRNAHDYGLQVRVQQEGQTLRETEIVFVNEAKTEELAEIELQLTRATGQPPSEDAVICEWERRREASMALSGYIG
jgi:hypothetical protein